MLGLPQILAKPGFSLAGLNPPAALPGAAPAPTPDEVPDLVLDMAAVHGLSEEEVAADPALWATLVAACHGCPDQSGCHAAFLAGELACPDETHFCPNHERLAGLARDLDGAD